MNIPNIPCVTSKCPDMSEAYNAVGTFGGTLCQAVKCQVAYNTVKSFIPTSYMTQAYGAVSGTCAAIPGEILSRGASVGASALAFAGSSIEALRPFATVETAFAAAAVAIVIAGIADCVFSEKKPADPLKVWF